MVVACEVVEMAMVVETGAAFSPLKHFSKIGVTLLYEKLDMILSIILNEKDS